MKQRLSILAALLVAVLVGVSAEAQSAMIKGRVRDAQTKDPLPYTNVLLLTTGLGSSTDKEGNYIIRNVPPGAYIIRASYVGYKTVETKIDVQGDATIEKDFLLSPVAIEGEVTTVTAQAEGQQQAINEQLASISVKNVVSLARIRELPDANAAESVTRLPGVSLIRTGGEGSKVVIRGLSPQYNRVTIDGVELPANVTSSDPNEHRSEFRSNDELSLSGDRASDLSMISSGILGGIEVIKAITPDMDATVIGGVVNFTMRKAVKTTVVVPRFELLTQGRHNSLKDSYNDYKVEGSYEQRFRDDRIGLFLQGSIEDKNLSANELGASYEFAGRLQATDEGQPDFQNMNLTDVLRDRDRYGATLVLDYVHETGDVGFMNFFSRSKTRSISRNESYDPFNDDLFFSATNSNTTLDVYSNLLSIKQRIAGIGIDARFSHSYSESKNPEDVRFNFWQNVAGFAGKYSALRYESPSEIASNVRHDPENAVFFDIYNVGNLSKDRTLNGAIDFTHDFTISGLVTSKIKFGGSYQHRSRSYDYNQSSGSVFYDDGGQVAAAIRREYPQFGGDITFADFIDPDYDYGDFLKGDYALGPSLDVDLMLKIIEIAKRNPGVGNGGGYKPHKLSSLLYDYSGDEARSAGYTMLTLNIGQRLTLVPGVRYQNLTTEYKGIRGEQIPGDIQYTEAKETQSHGYWLPMGHLRYKPLDWMQFHFAYTNTLNYPDYNTIIPRYYIGTNFVLYNNYRLKPGRSENFDAMLTFFANEIGLFSIGGFKKKINDLLLPSKSFPTDFSAYPELAEKLKNRTEKFTLHTYVNSSQPIDVIGMETEWQTNFWYLPKPLNGIVLNVNYTHIFSEAKYPKTILESYIDENFIQRTRAVDTTYTSRLLNQPNDIMNVSVGYDLGGFSARASMLYQDNIFKRPDFWLQNRVHSDKYVRFDLSVKQRLPWYGIQIYFNLNNITGEDDVDINQKTGFPTYDQRYGMTAEVGTRVKL
jgi:TonB-dependent receptor